MSGSEEDRNDVIPAGLALWREKAGELADQWIGFCYDCDACLDECTAAKFGVDFSPREVMLKVQFGLAETLLHTHSMVWQCFECSNCRDRCHQDIKPVNVMRALKEMVRDAVLEEARARAAG